MNDLKAAAIWRHRIERDRFQPFPALLVADPKACRQNAPTRAFSGLRNRSYPYFSAVFWSISEEMSPFDRVAIRNQY